MRYLGFGAARARSLPGSSSERPRYEDARLDVSLDLFDAYRELGGNVVDTGREYGNARSHRRPAGSASAACTTRSSS